MADIIEQQDTSLILDAATVEARNAEARIVQSALKARESSSITAPGSRTKSVEIDDADNALAAAFKEATGENPPGEIPPAGTVTKAPGIPDNPAAPKTPAELEAARELEAKVAADAAKKAAGDTLDDLLASATTKVEDRPTEPERKVPSSEPSPYAEHALPANASQKSRDSFENLRKAAVEREAAQRTRAESAEAKLVLAEVALKETQSKVGALTPELESELKELREHRALFATETDPAFKQKYDSRQLAQYEEIYAQLRGHQLSEDEITALKGMPKAERDANIDRYLGLLSDAAHKRPIESRMLKIEGIEEERKAELAATKVKADEVVKTLRTAPAQQTQARLDSIANLVRPKLTGLDWISLKEVTATTPPETKKAYEAHNEFAKRMQHSLREAITDDSVETRAVAALAVPLSYYFSRELNSTKAELAEVKARLEKIIKAGATSRLGERASVKSDIPAKPNLDVDAKDALDDLFKQAGGNLGP